VEIMGPKRAIMNVKGPKLQVCKYWGTKSAI
jgi:hypothetical protein